MTPTTLAPSRELTEAERRQAAQLERVWAEPRGFVGWFKAVHHTTIGMRYVVTAFCFFLVAGLLAALTGTPLPCLKAIDEAHRHPECLVDVRARLDHGDTAGALAAVENLLGPGALLRSGALRDELETAALRRIRHGLFRAGLAGLGPGPATRPGRRSRDYRAHPRHALSR